MATYKEMQQQIAKLQQEAETLRRQEVVSVIDDIRQKMIDYNISIADLGFRLPTTPKNTKKDGTVTRGEPKYMDPITGITWTGKGKAPKWIKDYEAEGKAREDFLII